MNFTSVLGVLAPLAVVMLAACSEPEAAVRSLHRPWKLRRARSRCRALSRRSSSPSPSGPQRPYSAQRPPRRYRRPCPPRLPDRPGRTRRPLCRSASSSSPGGPSSRTSRASSSPTLARSGRRRRGPRVRYPQGEPQGTQARTPRGGSRLVGRLGRRRGPVQAHVGDRARWGEQRLRR